MIETQSKVQSKIIRALWYAWQRPDLGRHGGTLDQVTDAVVCEAYAAIRGGAAGLGAAAVAGGPVADLLDLVYNYPPPKKLLKRYEQRQQASGGELAADIWSGKKTTMTAVFAHFDGSYPEPDHKATCETHWMISGHGNKAEKVTPVTFSLWRGYTMRGGELVTPCPHCRHERVMSFCKKIEKGSAIYPDNNMMRYETMTAADAKRAGARLRKRNERATSYTAVSYTTFPLANGRVIFLHDAPDIGGKPLPHDRGALYDLVGEWALQTPKGKRAGHGLGTWGGVKKRNEKPSGNKEAKPGKDTDQGQAWRIMGKRYGRFATILGAHLETNIPRKGASIDLDVADLSKFMSDAGFDYAVIKGDFPEDVTLSRYKTKKTSAKCDNGTLPEPIGAANDAEPLPLGGIFT